MTPKTIMSSTSIWAKRSCVKPMEEPKAVTSTPNVTKDTLIPTVNSTWPKQSAFKALTSTMG